MQVGQSRQCPICEQMVPKDTNEYYLNEKVIHKGCGDKIGELALNRRLVTTPKKPKKIKKKKRSIEGRTPVKTDTQQLK